MRKAKPKAPALIDSIGLTVVCPTCCAKIGKRCGLPACGDASAHGVSRRAVHFRRVTAGHVQSIKDRFAGGVEIVRKYRETPEEYATRKHDERCMIMDDIKSKKEARSRLHAEIERLSAELKTMEESL